MLDRRKQIPRLAMLCACLGAVACSHYRPAPLEPRMSADRFASRRIGEVVLPDGLRRAWGEACDCGWPPSHWDRAALLAVAWTQNPEIRVARAEVLAAQAAEVTAAELANPDVLLQSEYARHDPHPWLYGVELNWLLRSATRRRLERDIAGAETHGKRLELMDRLWSVRSDLATALSDWEGSRRRLDVLRRLVDTQKRLVAIEARRVRAGEDTPVELLTVQQAAVQLDRDIAAEHERTAAAQGGAAKAMGLPPEALDDLDFAWAGWGEPPNIDPGARREAREAALLSRADLGAAIDAYAAADERYHLAVQRQYPELELGPGYYWDHGIAKFPFNVGFTLPLNRNRGEIAETSAARDLAGQRMLALQAEIYGEISAADRAESVARASAEAAARELEIAARQQRHAARAVDLGATGADQGLAADLLVLRTELELTELRARVQSARNALEDALHAPLSGPEIALAGMAPALAEGRP